MKIFTTTNLQAILLRVYLKCDTIYAMSKDTKIIVENSLVSLGFISILWIVFIADLLTTKHLFSLGIEPRTTNGLIGIFLAPFLHNDFGHLLSNSWPLLPLMFYLLIWGSRIALEAIIFITITSGLCVWTLAPSGQVHAGASGLIYGLIGFLIVGGFMRKQFFYIGISLIIIFFYGRVAIDAFTGIASTPGVSWQSHLFGLLSGVTYAAFFSKGNKADKTTIV